MTETVARKASVGWLCALCFIPSIVLIVYGLVLADDEENIVALFLLMVGVLAGVIGVVVLVRLKRRPAAVISREGDILHCPDGSFAISDLTAVVCRRAHGRRINYRWGAVILTVGGTEHKYDFVADVEEVQKRLWQLMREYQEK